MSHITFNNGNMIYQYIIEFHKVFFFIDCLHIRTVLKR